MWFYVNYDPYKEAVLKAAYRNDTDGNLRAGDESRIQETYANAGIELDETTIEKELVAEATEKIISDPDGLIVQQILDSGDIGVIARLKMKLQAFLARRKAKKDGSVDAYDAMRTAQQRLSEALKAAGKRAADPNAEADATIGLETTGRKRGELAYGAEGEQVQFAIERDQNGDRYVRIEEDILKGVQEEDWVKTVRNALRDRFPEGVTVGNNQIRITGKSRGEITESKYTMWLKHNEPEMYADKLRAIGNADEILVVSDKYVNEEPNHQRKDRIVSFARGTATLDVGGNGYDASVIVGTKDDGEMILYDLVDMKSVQIKKRAQRTAGQDAVHDRSAVSSDIRVAETQTDVNTQYMQDGMQYALASNQFANETIQRLSTFSDETKAVLAGRGHEAVANTERMDAAWQAMNERGRDTLMDKPVENIKRIG